MRRSFCTIFTTALIGLTPFVTAAELSALLGGMAAQEDAAVLTARGLDDSGRVIQTVTVGPVTARDRNSQTGLLPCQTTERLTPGTRNIVVELTCIRLTYSDNNCFADNLRLMIRKRAQEVVMQEVLPLPR